MENTNTTKKYSGPKKSDDPIRAFINKNFIIKYKVPGVKGDFLVSAGKYAALLDKHHPTTREGSEERKNKDFQKVMKSKEAVINIKIRDGLSIKFISK